MKTTYNNLINRSKNYLSQINLFSGRIVMKKVFLQLTVVLIVSIILLLITACERDIAGLEPAAYPTDAGIYIDGFEAGVDYQAFGGSLLTSLGIDNKEGYESNSSLTFTVPDVGDPNGMFAGGVFISPGGRNLTGYDALTFYAKASIQAEIGVVGFGNDNAGNSTYLAERANIPVTTVWKKYILPIPDPSKLDIEKGLFHTAIGAIDDYGFKIWFDEIQFEKLGTIAQQRPTIPTKTINAEVGDSLIIQGTTLIANVAGVDVEINTSPYYFTFSSSNDTVVTVDESKLRVVGVGTSEITAKLLSYDAEGVITVTTQEAAPSPQESAPVPEEDAADVISIFSNVYTNVSIDKWSADWDMADYYAAQADGDDVLFYKNFNYAAIEFTTNLIDASQMTHIHFDVWTPDAISGSSALIVKIADFGTDGQYQGGDDSEGSQTLNQNSDPALASGSWLSYDIPLSNFAGLSSNANLAQIV